MEVFAQINSIQMKETAKEKSETQEKIFADRIYQVDAAIVRIMKTRKTLSHQQLILELLKQVRTALGIRNSMLRNCVR